MLRDRLFYTVCALAMTPAMGCVFVADGNGNNGNGNGNGDARGHFDVAWKVDGLSETGDGCLELDGADTIEIVSQPLSGGTTTVDKYDCEDGAAVTPLLPLDDYDVWANAKDADGRLLAQSQIVATSLDYDGELRVIDEELVFLTGQFEASWDLTEEITEDPLTCEGVNAGGVSLVSTLAGDGGTAFDDIYECEDGIDPDRVQTPSMALGAYTVSISLLEAETDDVLGQVEKDGTLATHASVEDLGVFNFTFAPETAHFNVFWDNSTDEAAAGCQAFEDPDRELLTVEFTFERSDGFRAVERFDCEETTSEGLTAPLPLGDYDIWANVRDADDRLLGSSDGVATASLTTPGEEVEVPTSGDFTFLGGWFELGWDIFESDGTDSSCAGSVQESVSVLSTLAGSGGTGFDDVYFCEDGDGSTDPGTVLTPLMPLGDYQIAITLLDENDDVIGAPEGDDALIETALSDHFEQVNLGIIDIFLLD